MTTGDIDLEYLREALEQADFKPFPWNGEDRNLAAFRSKKDLIDWYCQPPGKEGEPYRDRGFYCRELAYLSRVIQPRTIVEFGTSLGIGTCLLSWLNPIAELVSVDVNRFTYMPGDIKVLIGYLAQYQGIKFQQVFGNSWEYARLDGVDLCFIDGDHSYEAVKKDSDCAWLNCTLEHRWAIMWHDYNDRHPGVMQAVQEFCEKVGHKLQSRPDSDTVWIEG